LDIFVAHATFLPLLQVFIGENFMENTLTPPSGGINRAKFAIGGLLILAAVVYLVITATMNSAEYFVTVEDLAARAADGPSTRNIRVSGAVLGDTIEYDSSTLTLRFTIVHVPGSNREIEAQGGLARVLHNAVNNPDLPRIPVVYEGHPKPDLLQHEAQAILTGRMNDDGVFYANELLLKCPTKYEEVVPEQSEG
jgi:cytochrome c-type biogenesis protein CcmE